MEKNFSYTIPEGEHKGKTLWSGRYATAVAYVFCKDNGNTYILADKRGIGAPTYHHYWNVPCGYIEKGEDGFQAAARECYEETGIVIPPYKFELLTAECNANENNVNLIYYTITNNLYYLNRDKINQWGGEENEVEDINWINIKDIYKYKWAFKQDRRIEECISTGLLS